MVHRGLRPAAPRTGRRQRRRAEVPDPSRPGSELDGQPHEREGFHEWLLGLRDAEDHRQVREHAPGGLAPCTQLRDQRDDAIAQLLKSTSSDDILAQTLVDAANAAGGKDNISVILVRATGGRPKRSLLPRWWMR